MSTEATITNEESTTKATKNGTNVNSNLSSSNGHDHHHHEALNSYRPGLLSQHQQRHNMTSTSSLSTNAIMSVDPAMSTRSLGSSTATMNSGSIQGLQHQQQKVRRIVAATRPGAVSVMPGEPEERVTTSVLQPPTATTSETTATTTTSEINNNNNNHINNNNNNNDSFRSLVSSTDHSSRSLGLKARRTSVPATVPGAVHVMGNTKNHHHGIPTTTVDATETPLPPPLTEENSTWETFDIPTMIGVGDSSTDAAATPAAGLEGGGGEQNTSSRSLMTTTSALTHQSHSSSGKFSSKPTRRTSAIRPGAVHVLPGNATFEPAQDDQATVSSGGSGGGGVKANQDNDDNDGSTPPPSLLTHAEHDLLHTKSRVRNSTTLASTATLPGAVAVSPTGMEQALEPPSSSHLHVPPAVLAAVEQDLMQVKSRKAPRTSVATTPGAVAVGPDHYHNISLDDATEPPTQLSRAEQDLQSKMDFNSSNRKGTRNTGTIVPGAVAVISPTTSTIMEQNEQDLLLEIPSALSEVERDLETKTRHGHAAMHQKAAARNTGTMTPGAVHVAPMEEPDALTPPTSLMDVERDLMNMSQPTGTAGHSKLLLSNTKGKEEEKVEHDMAAVVPGMYSMTGDDAWHPHKDPRSLALAERRRSSHTIMSSSLNVMQTLDHDDDSEEDDGHHTENGMTDHQRMEAKIIRMEQEEEARARLRDMQAATSSNSHLNSNNNNGAPMMITANVVVAQRPPPPLAQFDDHGSNYNNNASFRPPTTMADQGVVVPPPVVSGTTQLPPHQPYQQYQQQQGPLEDNPLYQNNSRNKGLAVAIAVTERDEDDEDDHITRVMGVEYEPNDKPPLYHNRRFRLYAVVAAVLLLAVIAGSLGAVFSKGSSTSTQVAPTLAPLSSTEKAYFDVFAQATQNQLVYQLDTPHRVAADWILNVDPLHLALDSNHLIQRYILALFYLQMSDLAQRPWMSCNPPQTGENETCVFANYVVQTADVNGTIEQVGLYQPQTGYNRWLSGAHECTWAGVVCDPNNITNAVELLAQNLTGTLPTEIGALSFLEGFSVPINQIEGTIPSFYATGLKHLVQLELHYNVLTGTFSDLWYQNTGLLLLNLGGNSLTGSISSDVKKLSNLYGLHLFGNHLTGTIPTEIGDLRYLVKTRLSDNMFQGTIPSEFGRLSALEEFWLFDNMLTGTIPSEIGLLTQLTDLQWSDNKLNGTIPEEFYNLNQLQIGVDLSDMSLTGTLSTRIGNLTSLQVLKLRRNHFTGTVPSELALLTNLLLVWLHLNDFTGSIPSQICNNRGSALDGKLGYLDADCGPPGHPAQACQCCTGCCDRSTAICLSV